MVASLNFAGAHTLANIDVDAAEPVTLRLRLPSRVDGVSLAAGMHISLSWRAAECRLVLV
jgi:hypothetical protein